MKKALFLFLTFITFTVYCQNYSQLNSLKQEILNNPNDTLKIKNFFNTVNANRESLNSDSSLNYLKFIYQTSSTIKFDKLTANVCNILGNIYNGTGE